MGGPKKPLPILWIWSRVPDHFHPQFAHRAGVALLVSVGSAFIIGDAIQHTLQLSRGYPFKAGGFLIMLAAMSLPALRLHPFPFVGLANMVTLVRGVLTGCIAALIGEPHLDGLLWLATPAALVALAMDGLDGYTARRLGIESPFGARLDMELDALMTMVLAALVWLTGRAPVWVLASGAMRYLFVAAAVFAPWLAAPLPPRYRRKVVCVVQIGSLILCLLPPLQPPLTTAIAAGGLIALVGSFGTDVVWLWRHR